MPKDYIHLVNIKENKKEKRELESLRYSVNKGKPYGSENWKSRMIDRFNLGSALKGAGRPINRSWTPLRAIADIAYYVIE